MGENQNVREIPTINNFSINKNQGKLKSNDRKRKQIADISSKTNRNSKIRALLDNAEVKVTKFEGTLFTLQQLPMVLLSQIASNLNIREQKNFADTCKVARLGMKFYWDTRTDLHIGTLMRQSFSFVNEQNRYSLHSMRREVGLTLRLMSNFALRKINFQPIYLLHLQDLKDIEARTRKSAREIYGAVEHLDLRGCLVEYGELQYFSNACRRLSSIALTHDAVFLPNEIFTSEDFMKQNGLEKCPFGSGREFLRLSLPNFAEMEKKGQLPVEHIELLVKLLILFPCLETFQIA